MDGHPFPGLRDHMSAHSVLRGDFRLKSGQRSDWFCDAKRTTCAAEGMLLVAKALRTVIPEGTTALGGMTVGGDAIAYATVGILAAWYWEFTAFTAFTAFTVRNEANGHGTGGRIAGPLGPSDRVVITEDVATRGVSMLEAAAAVTAVGAEVLLLCPLVDRGGTAAVLAAEEGYDYRALLTAPDLGFPYDSGEGACTPPVQ